MSYEQMMARNRQRMRELRNAMLALFAVAAFAMASVAYATAIAVKDAQAMPAPQAVASQSINQPNLAGSRRQPVSPRPASHPRQAKKWAARHCKCRPPLEEIQSV